MPTLISGIAEGFLCPVKLLQIEDVVVNVDVADVVVKEVAKESISEDVVGWWRLFSSFNDVKNVGDGEE